MRLDAGRERLVYVDRKRLEANKRRGAHSALPTIVVRDGERAHHGYAASVHGLVHFEYRHGHQVQVVARTHGRIDLQEQP